MGLITNFMVPLTGVYRKYILGKTVNTTVPLRGLIEIIPGLGIRVSGNLQENHVAKIREHDMESALIWVF